jgi:hypothetical protein
VLVARPDEQVVLELRPLAELQRVPDGERMEAERLGDQPHVVRRRPAHVQPEEAAREPPLERCAGERDVVRRAGSIHEPALG